MVFGINVAMYRGRIWDSTHPRSFSVSSFCLLSFLLSAKMRFTGENVSRFDIVKHFILAGDGRCFPFPKSHEQHHWNALFDGRCYVE